MQKWRTSQIICHIETFEEKLVEEIDNGSIRASNDLKVNSSILIDKYGQDQQYIKDPGRNT